MVYTLNMSTTNIILIIIAVVVLWVVYAYNRFVQLVNRAKEAWADIEVQLKRRYDLIPNLVETVKGYATYESSVFENVTKARAATVDATGTARKAQAENMLTDALKSLFAVAEAYPDLKANQNFLQLQKELGDTEDKIQASRRFYNTSVMTLNTAIESFPGNVIASSFSFNQMDLFELGEDEKAAKQTVTVKF
jgi:LemA protein